MSMIIPRGWIPRKQYIDAGQAHINDMVALSKPVQCPGVLTLFTRQAGAKGGTEKLRANGRKASGAYMAKLFAKNQAEKWNAQLRNGEEHG